MKLFGRKKREAAEAFPFDESPNTATFVCVHVMEKQRPILYATYDEDGYRQFLCGAEHTAEEARLVSLESVWEQDKTVGELVQMECGQRAHRKDEHSRWEME